MKDRNYDKSISYHCPRCKDINVWELDKYIYCPQCALTFNKNQLNKFHYSEILSTEELEKIVKVLNKQIDI